LCELPELRVDAVADRAAGSGKEFYFTTGHGFSLPEWFICPGGTVSNGEYVIL
jgi:hypothetical protein